MKEHRPERPAVHARAKTARPGAADGPDDAGGGAHVTLQDVARRAEVSLATASRVLNGTTQVRPDLRERVLAAASELAYAPNAHAQALARASSQAIGLICHDVSDPYFAAIARGVTRTATEHGLLVMLASTFRDPTREVDYVAMLRAQRARAILLIGSGFEDRAWERSMSAELDPYVRAGGRVAVLSRHRGLRVDTVQPENREGAAALARDLLALGHRDFAVLTGPRALTTVVDRLGGFRDALAEAGVPLPDDQVVEGSFSRDGGFAAATELVRRGSRATCVFALTDVMAIGALSAFRHHGIDVPSQVSLAGFDDIPIVRDLVPSLTTVALPLEGMGERVMSLALRAPARRSRVERISGEVVLRATTAAPPEL
ncbi:LacI family DNA-binding transcriptional regulator [Actinoallomurus iriomotensis]|uniref:LacI family transcriptional regulator n=1 Tax=Actinoallomurus iriomotensis TaxID=478107 RepID=A0A9W6W626_9ACTN|nr:LacI family transcriptional regulator [Actinoallomurus iriomotensis]